LKVDVTMERWCALSFDAPNLHVAEHLHHCRVEEDKKGQSWQASLFGAKLHFTSFPNFPFAALPEILLCTTQLLCVISLQRNINFKMKQK